MNVGTWVLRATGGVLGLLGILMLVKSIILIWTMWVTPLLPDPSGRRVLALFVMLPGDIVINANSPLMGLLIGGHVILGLLFIGACTWCLLFRKDRRTTS